MTTFVVACSTGTLARFPSGGDPATLAAYLRQIEADAVEVLFYGRWREDLRGAADALRRCGHPIPVVHAEKNLGGAFGSADPDARADGHRRFLDALRLAEQLGARKLVLHLWDRPDSDRFLDRNLDALAALLPRARDAGITTCVETIPCDASNPVDNVRRCLEHFGVTRPGGDLAVTLDLEFLGWHDCVERALGSAFGAPVGAPALVADVHVRDYDGQPFAADGRRRYLDPGDGRLDFPAIFGALVRQGFNGPFTYEGAALPDSADPVAGVNRVLQRMRTWLHEVAARPGA
ncbi:MAG TPA: sugar phosphate isomerase/epimerase family protein [Chloroflexota bacterium]|nr:sugar phosphate isomerase/epimerase family protein [Chloroflexota bacterium]